MRAILGIIRNRWFIASLGLIAAAAIIWILGPLFGFAGRTPLESEFNRLLLIVFVVLIWGLNQLRRYLTSQKKNQQMLDSVVGQSEQADAEITGSQESAEELEILRQRMDDAIGILKNSTLGGKHNRQYLYQLPWYIFIGPPGSGKTTALLNSGLNFPLADKLGKDAIQGVGGTRNCDWWFTDDAVLLDTAGRYTTQDSYEEVDRAAWSGFLDLLKKHRKRRPINGTLIAISIEDILQQTELERLSHAQAIRKRIQELHDRLGIRFPIYVLFTKCDLLAGFSEFFENMGREERKQVWGMTFPLAEDEKDHPKGVELFGKEFAALEQRIDSRLLDRLEQERDIRRRALIYSFPHQFGSIAETADRFLKEVFSPNRFEETPLLRGIYFTSGTQEGTPIDRLLGSMAEGFGLNRQIAPSFSGSGRSYFLADLFGKLVFRESHLAGINTRVEQQRAWLQRIAYGAALGMALLAGAAWFTSYSRNVSFVDQVSEKAGQAEQLVQTVSPQELEPLSALPALNAVQHIPGGFAERATSVPLLMGLGLYQGDKLGDESQKAYFRTLKHVFLPRLIFGVEEQLQQPGNNPDYQYEALKVYLMFDDPEHFDSETIKAWIVLHWQLSLEGQSNAQARQSLINHLDALLEQLPYAPPVPLNQALIEQVRTNLLQISLAERVYSRLKRANLSGPVPPFRLGSAIGPEAGRVFERKSGRSLDAEIPGLFTYRGYKQIFLKEQLVMAERLLEEKWILGPGADRLLGQIDLLQLSREVRSLYFSEYIQIWDLLLDDIRIVPFRNIQHAVEVLNILSGPGSPLLKMLRLVAQETTLDRMPQVTQVATDSSKQNLPHLTGKLAKILQVTPDEGEEQPRNISTKTIVDQHFSDLHELVRSGDGEPAPIERSMTMLNELYAHMNSISSAVNQSNRAFDVAREESTGSIAGQIKLEAKRQPALLAELLTEVATASSDLTVSGVRSHLNSLWRSTVLPFFQRSLANRYPLNRTSSKEATIDDFGRFFGPGGLVDEFFSNSLSSFVDTSGRVWRWTASGNQALGIPSSTLRQFQRAAAIRDTFFAGGGKLPGIRFDMKPLSMDTSISQFSLLLNGQRVTYNHGPARWTSMQWPDESGRSEVKILLAPPAGDKPSGTSEDGPWGWFRMLDRSGIKRTDSPESLEVTFDVGARKTRFLLRASSALNPFSLKELDDFWCPNKL